MPRLRYYKNYDWSDDNETENQTSGTSWLSNVAIAGSLSDARLKQAIITLKAQISVLENELVARNLNRGNNYVESEFKIGRLRRVKGNEKPRGVTKRTRKTTKLQTITSTLHKLGLSTMQSEALLTEWGKILSGGKK